MSNKWEKNHKGEFVRIINPPWDFREQQSVTFEDAGTWFLSLSEDRRIRLQLDWMERNEGKMSPERQESLRKQREEAAKKETEEYRKEREKRRAANAQRLRLAKANQANRERNETADEKVERHSKYSREQWDKSEAGLLERAKANARKEAERAGQEAERMAWIHRQLSHPNYPKFYQLATVRWKVKNPSFANNHDYVAAMVAREWTSLSAWQQNDCG